MFSLNSSLTYYLYRESADMRKGFDSLSGLVQTELQGNPHSGEVFVFVNKRRDCMKLLRWEPNGFILYHKRLERGTFSMPLKAESISSNEIRWPDLVMMIEGISFDYIRRRKRFSVG